MRISKKPFWYTRLKRLTEKIESIEIFVYLPIINIIFLVISILNALRIIPNPEIWLFSYKVSLLTLIAIYIAAETAFIVIYIIYLGNNIKENGWIWILFSCILMVFFLIVSIWSLYDFYWFVIDVIKNFSVWFPFITGFVQFLIGLLYTLMIASAFFMFAFHILMAHQCLKIISFMDLENRYKVYQCFL
ncbi:hypothetical protein [Mycoplasma sp. 246B]